jgi:hypothetical protein
VLHLTRGKADPASVREAAERLRASAGPSATLFHLALTEQPHRSLAYPADRAQIEGECLAALWECSSRLACAAALASKRPGLSAESRGFVVNGKFDLLLECLGAS